MKLYQMLLAKTQQKGTNTGTNTAIIEQEQKLERMRADLLELEVELVYTGSAFTDFRNIIDCLKAVLSGDWQTLDARSNGSDNSTKKKLNTEKEKWAPLLCCIIIYNVNIR